MARTQVYLRIPDSAKMLAKTDLHGHGNVRVGEEFVALELSWYGKPKLVPGGRKLRVRVVRTERETYGLHWLWVEILEDLTPAPARQEGLFQQGS